MKKRLSWCLMLILLTFTLAGCTSSGGGGAQSAASTQGASDTQTASGGAEAVADGEPIKVGVCLVQSGPMGGVVDYLIPTVEMAFEEINAQGGIDGHPIELVFRDDQGDTSLVAQRLTELKEEGCQVIIGPLLDTQAPAAAEWAGENQIPVLTTCTMATNVSIENFNDYIYCTGPSAWAQARVLEQYVLDKGYKTIYMVGSVGGVVEDNFGFFEEEMKELDPEVTVLVKQMIQMTDSDFQAIISDIQAKKPDLVVFDSGAQAANFLQQGIQFDLFSTVQTFGFDFLSPLVTESYGADFPTTIASCTWVPAFSGTPEMTEYREKLYERIQSYPMSLTIQCHNAALAVIATLQACGGDYSPAHIAETVKTVSFQSPIGECYFRAFDHQLVFPMAYSEAIYDGEHEFAVEGNLVYLDESRWPTEEERAAYAESLQ